MMDYDKMQPGREMDALVAERIFANLVRQSTPVAELGLSTRASEVLRHHNASTVDDVLELIQTHGSLDNLRGCGIITRREIMSALNRAGPFLPNYSTDIAAAWLVCERMLSPHISEAAYERFDDAIMAGLALHLLSAPDAALEICRAALKAAEE